MANRKVKGISQNKCGRYYTITPQVKPMDDAEN